MVFLDVAFFAIAVCVSFLVAWPPVGARVRSALRCTRPDAAAIVVCGATKTVALGVPLVTVLYGRADYAGLLAAPLVAYHALQILLGGAALGGLRRWVLGAPAPWERRRGGGEAPAPAPAAAA